MNFNHLFTKRIQDLESLPEKPNIFWYPSAGKDFRGNVFLTDRYIEHNKKHHGKRYLKPDLFVFNCLGIGEVEEIKNNIKLNKPLFEDDITKIIGKNLQEFGIKSNMLNLTINPNYVENEMVIKPQKGKEAFYFEIRILDKEDNHIESQRVLYLIHENIDVFQKIILKGYLNVLYLCATREGCGMGGCKKSIVEYIYKDAFPYFYSKYNFKPAFSIIFNDFTKDIFEQASNNSDIIETTHYDYYIDENINGIEPDSTVYKIKYLK